MLIFAPDMEENFDALDVIVRTRGKVYMDGLPAGKKLFPMWGWLAVVFYLLEFVLMLLFRQEWCYWVWLGIPAIGVPAMVSIIRKDREHSHMRTRASKLVLDYWIFAASAICIGGFLFGFLDIYEIVENPLICLLIGIGAFITGEEIRCRPMTVGGLVGASIGIASFLIQGDMWIYQMLCIVACAIVALIVPGYLFEKSVKNEV